MSKRRPTYYQFLVAVVALYGVMSACVCMDHAPSTAVSACHQCSPSNSDSSKTQLVSHHQCCGMERAPIAIEGVSSATPALSDVHAVLHSNSPFSDTSADSGVLSTFSHAPPGDIPIYFTTQRFLI